MNKENEKDLFLKKIEGRRDVLEMLSLDRLKVLENYYDEIIEKNNQEIEKLKKSF